jgi:hypothetical protein
MSEYERLLRTRFFSKVFADCVTNEQPSTFSLGWPLERSVLARLGVVEFYFMFGYFHRLLDDATPVHSSGAGDVMRDRDPEDTDG